MSFSGAVSSFFVNYSNFRDRASRAELWWTMLFYMVASFVVGLIAGLLTGPIGFGIALLVQLIWSIGTAVPLLALFARRLHDVGRSGWWQLIYMVPLLGFIMFIYWGVLESEGSNEWGAPAAA